MIKGIERAKIDWQRLVLDLRRHHSLKSLGNKLDVNYQTLGRLSRGDMKEPKFSEGLLLLDIHSDLCGCDATKRLKLG